MQGLNHDPLVPKYQRGWRPLKLPSLRRLLNLSKPDIIFLQETLVIEEKARHFLISLCPSWMTSTVIAVGNSGGLSVAWNPLVFGLQSYLRVGGIFLTSVYLLDKSMISFINAYDPCTGIRQFWDLVESKGFLARDDLILAGDLNFTINIEEVWGEGALPDPLAAYFRTLFGKSNLVDVQPAELVPTWRDRRTGTQNIQKRLDRMYVSEALLVDSVRYRSWVIHPFFSDHAPIIFQLEHGDIPIAFPFKFNHAVLSEATVGEIVRMEWRSVPGSGVLGAQRRLSLKLNKLKNRIISWTTKKKINETRILKSLEEQISILTKQS